MDTFAKDYEASVHHLKTVISAKDDREAVRRLIVARQHIDKCIDGINESNKRKHD